MTTHVRWRDADGKKHVTSADTETEASWDLSNATPLHAGMTLSVGGIQMTLTDPGGVR